MDSPKTWSGSLFARLGFAALIGLLVAGAVVCRAEKSAAAKTGEMLTLATLTPVFGQAEDVRSGLADFTQSDTEIVLSYHLYLTDMADPVAAISRDLAPKIRKLYGHFPHVDRVSFGISLPDQSSPGNWNPYVSFTLTRKIVKETGWSDLMDTDLLSVALDVHRARSGHASCGDEPQLE
jgi:hypothetical protein